MAPPFLFRHCRLLLLNCSSQADSSRNEAAVLAIGLVIILASHSCQGLALIKFLLNGPSTLESHANRLNVVCIILKSSRRFNMRQRDIVIEPQKIVLIVVYAGHL